jgi:hypothetical protein
MQDVLATIATSDSSEYQIKHSSSPSSFTSRVDRSNSFVVALTSAVCVCMHVGATTEPDHYPLLFEPVICRFPTSFVTLVVALLTRDQRETLPALTKGRSLLKREAAKHTATPGSFSANPTSAVCRMPNHPSVRGYERPTKPRLLSACPP